MDSGFGFCFKPPTRLFTEHIYSYNVTAGLTMVPLYGTSGMSLESISEGTFPEYFTSDTLSLLSYNPQFNLTSGSPALQIDLILDMMIINTQKAFSTYVEAFITHQGITVRDITYATVNVHEVSEQIPCDMEMFNNTTSIGESDSTGTMVFSAYKDAYSNYGFIAPRHGDIVSIDAVTGTIVKAKHFTAASLDTDEIALVITATREPGCPIAILGTLVIKIEWANNPPMFTQTVYYGSVRENSPIGTIVNTGRIWAKDGDRGDQGLVRYSSSSSLFFVDEQTAAVVTLGYLDAEVESNYTFNVHATDGNTTSTSVIVITVIDENDNAPVFTHTIYDWNVSEDTSLGLVGGIIAVDKDITAPNNVVSYEIIDNPYVINFPFIIETDTGRILLDKTLNREDVTSYYFQVRASDLGNPSLSEIASVYISVVDTNDNSPVFHPPYMFEISEDTFGSTAPFAVISATDNDAENNAKLSFTLSPNDTFTIDESTGEMFSKVKLDFESQTLFYVLMVTVSDNGDPKRSTQRSISIVVTDVNDNIPEFVSHSKDVRLTSSCVQTGRPVAFFDITDADTVARNSPFIFFYAGNASAYFEINNRTVVTVRKDVPPGYYTATVAARDTSSTNQELSFADLSISVISDGERCALYQANLNQECRSGDSFLECVEPHTACLEDVSGIWRCKCVRNHFSNGSRCIQAPENLFRETKYNFVITKTVVGNTTVGEIELHDDVDLFLSSASPNAEVTVDAEELTVAIMDAKIMIRTTRSFTRFLSAIVNLEIQNTDIRLSDKVYITVSTHEVTQISLMVIGGTTAHSIVGDVTDTGIGPYIINDYDVSLSGSVETILYFSENTASLHTKQDINIDTLSSSKIHASWYTYGSITFTKKINSLPDLSPISVKLLVYKQSFSVEISEDKPTRYVFAKFGTNNEWDLKTDTTLFTLDNTAKVLSLKGPLNYFFQTDYDFTVTLTDVLKSVDISVHVSVLDTNNNPPEFPTDTYFINLIEGTLAGTVIGHVQATDKDTVGNVVYGFADSSSSTVMSIGEYSGILTATRVVNRLTFGRILDSADSKFFIQASDGKHMVQAGVEVTIMSLDKSRLFNYTFEGAVLENQASGAYVMSVAKADYTKYEFAKSTHHDYFTLDSTTGDVRSAREIDREALVRGDMISITVTAYLENDEACSFTVLGTAQITVLDENDNPPKFEDELYLGTIRENSTDGTQVVLKNVIRATDKDKDENAAITYHIQGSDSGLFTINNDGTVVSRTLDRETRNSYNLTVIAVDGTVSSFVRNTGTAFITVTVTDVNDNAPIFSKSRYSASIRENKQNVDFGTVYASDSDSGSNGEVRYNIAGGGDGWFTLHESAGTISSSKLDREMKSKYTLEIVAYDLGKVSQQTIAFFDITVLDENDESPFFHQPYEFIVAENVPCDSAFVTVNVTDKDEEGKNSRITYELSTNKDNFAIGVNGSLSCKVNLDFDEKPDEYSITVIATDGANPYHKTTAEIKVFLTDVNDNPPEFIPPDRKRVNITYSELKLNKPIAVVDVRDKDTGLNGKIERRFIGGNATAHFEVDVEHGVVRVKDKSSLHAGIYIATVEANDKGTPPLFNTAELEIEVFTDVDATFFFTKNDFDMNALEENSVKSHIGTLTIDNPNNEDIEFNLVDQHGGIFSVNSKGEVFCDAALDREVISLYKVVARVHKPGRPDVGDVAVITVNVKDINDHAPKFIETEGFMKSISENEPVGTTVIKLSATDKDEGNNARLEYRSSMDSPLRIDKDTGAVVVASALDREKPNGDKYQIEVIVVDQGTPQTKSAAVNVTIFVLDYNEHEPKFALPEYSITVMEDTRLTSEVLTLTATDEDATDVYRVTSYLLSTAGCYIGVQKIESTIGEISASLSLRESLDREKLASFQCTLTAKDGGDPALTGTSVINVAVGDVNDNTPKIVNAPREINISSATPVNEVLIASLQVVDDDTGVNADYIFSTKDNEDEAKISVWVDEKMGTVRLNGELATFGASTGTFIITVIDQGDPPLSSSVEIKVKISDENIKPWFAVNPYTYSIEEERISSQEYYITARDTDRANKTISKECSCTYRIQGDNDFFSIEPNTGLLKQIKAVDREIHPEIKLQIIGRDDGPDLFLDSEPTTVLFSIKDINDNPPTFQSLQYVFNLKQDIVGAGAVIGKVTAIDIDEVSDTKYTVIEGMSSAPFKVYADSGKIYAEENLKRNASFRIEFEVQATDAAKTNYFSRTSVIVKFSDKNMYAPQFVQDIYEVEVPVDTEPGEIISSMENYSANDSDVENTPESEITYSLSPSLFSDHFSINNQTARVSVLKELLYIEQEVKYISLIVLASDHGEPSKSGSCTIKIKLTGQRQHVCAGVSDQLTSEMTEKKTYFALFLALLALSVLSIIFAIALTCRYLNARHSLAKYKETEGDDKSMKFSGGLMMGKQYTDFHSPRRGSRDYNALQANTKDRRPSKPYDRFKKDDGYMKPRPSLTEDDRPSMGSMFPMTNSNVGNIDRPRRFSLQPSALTSDRIQRKSSLLPETISELHEPAPDYDDSDKEDYERTDGLAIDRPRLPSREHRPLERLSQQLDRKMSLASYTA